MEIKKYHGIYFYLSSSVPKLGDMQIARVGDRLENKEKIVAITGRFNFLHGPNFSIHQSQ